MCLLLHVRQDNYNNTCIRLLHYVLLARLPLQIPITDYKMQDQQRTLLVKLYQMSGTNNTVVRIHIPAAKLIVGILF
jgi:hypothetical protein